MFRATMKRLERELYEEPPVLVIRTLIRWMMTDPVYQIASRVSWAATSRPSRGSRHP